MNARRLLASCLFVLLSPFGAIREPDHRLSRLESSLDPFDNPAAAREFYLRKRSARGGAAADVVQEYRRALQQIEAMPIHLAHSNRLLPSAAEMKRQKNRQRRSASELLSVWEFLGPGNIGGRTRALLIDPGNPDVLYAAGVSGGIWKTENGGQSWKPLGDFLPNIAVNSMAMDPSSPRILYAGTGEGYFRELIRGTGLPLRGEGVFKSEDAGETWFRLPSTDGIDFHWVNDLAVSRNDPHRIYAATRTGVWRSPDAGLSWERVLDASSANGGCLRLALRADRPSDFLIASCGTFEQATLYRSTEAEGDGPWQAVLSEPGMGLTSLAYAPSYQDTVYALSASYAGGPGGRFNGGLHAVFRSDQGGASGTWRATVRNTDSNKLNTLLLTNPLLASAQVCGLGNDSYSTLGWYTNVIAVDPTDPEIVWAGGIDLFRSDDGGRNWGPVSHWAESPPSAHADQHRIVFHPDYDGVSNQTLFLGGDGGVWRTDNARAARSQMPNAPCSREGTDVRWTSLNRNYGVTQFYHGMPLPDGGSFVGGTQDNGTLLGSLSGGTDGWRHILGGDGGYVAVDPINPSVIYAESQFLNLRKSINGGRSFFPAVAGITESFDNFLFITPFQMDPSDSQQLWTGGRALWRTRNGAAFWEQASARLTETARVSALAVAPTDSNRVLAGLSDGSIHRQDQATVSGRSTAWPSARPRDGYVTGLAFDPADPDVAYATYAEFGGKHVWKTSDGGGTWTAIDGDGPTGLPDLPAHTIVVDPDRRDHLFLGTDLGVFTSLDGGENWAVENTGFSNTVTESLCLQKRPGTTPMLWAFTHGRGAWRVALANDPRPPGCEPERWIAHLTPPGVAYETTILVTGFGTDEEQVELVPYREDGRRLDSVFLRVGANTTYASPARRIFSDAPVSHFGICGPATIRVSAAYRSLSSPGTSAHVRETAEAGRDFLILPSDWDVVFEGMALVNLGPAAARIEASLVNELGHDSAHRVLQEQLAPQAKYVAVLDHEFADAHGAAVRLSSSQPAVLLLLRGTHSGRSPSLLFQTLPALRDAEDSPAPCDPTRWIVYFTPPDSDYETSLVAANFGANSASLEFVPYLRDGSRQSPVSLRVSGGGIIGTPASALFGSIAVSHVGICGPGNLTLTAAYRSVHPGAAAAHVPETSRSGTRFLFYPAEWDVVYDGMAVINLGDRGTAVDAVLLDGSGSELSRVRLSGNLPARAQLVALMEDVFAGSSGTAIRIESGQPVSILLLRGTRPDFGPETLYQTIPIEVPH